MSAELKATLCSIAIVSFFVLLFIFPRETFLIAGITIIAGGLAACWTELRDVFRD